MANKHTPTNPKDQRAAQAAARMAAQEQRGSNKFKNNSNVHRGGSQSQSGQPPKR